MDHELIGFAQVLSNLAREEARRTAVTLRRAKVLSVQTDGTVTLDMAFPESGQVQEIDEDDNVTFAPPTEDEASLPLSGVPVVQGATVTVGTDVVVLQQATSFLVLGGYGAAGGSGTPVGSEVRTPQPYGGWAWYAPYGTGKAQRTGIFVQMTGLIVRTAASFTPQGNSLYEYLTLPWAADTAQTGLIWSSVGAPMRWYVTAGSRTLNVMRAWDAQTVGTFTQNASYISCNLSYTTSET